MHVCARVPHHIRECFYCTSGLTHIPGVMWGRLAQGGEGTRAELGLDANVRPRAAGARPLRSGYSSSGLGREDGEDSTTLDVTDCPVAHDQCGPRGIDHSGAKLCSQDQVGCHPPSSSSSSSMISMFETSESSQRPPDSGNLRKRTV